MQPAGTVDDTGARLQQSSVRVSESRLSPPQFSLSLSPPLLPSLIFFQGSFSPSATGVVLSARVAIPTATMVNLDCRMYEPQFPEPDDVVMVVVKEIQEMGAYVHLLEYNNAQGMIMLSELSRRRIRSVNKLIRVGRQEVVAVVRVDHDKGYIDLSKRRVAPEDAVKMEEKWNKARSVHSIMRHIAETVDTDVEDLYVRWGWPLYKKYGHAYDAFRASVTDAAGVLAGLDIKDAEREELEKNVKLRLTVQPMKLRADIEVTCSRFEGVDAVRAALTAGEASSEADTPIKIKLVAPPLYVVTTSALRKADGIVALSKVLGVVEKEILARHGKFKVVKEPRAVSDKDDKQLSSLMEQLEMENREVGGDDDASDAE